MCAPIIRFVAFVMANLLSSLSDAPFIVTGGYFINPKFRNKRLPPDEWQVYQKMEIRVHNARLATRFPSLTYEGFELAHSPIRVDFGDEEQVKTRFYKHCSDLVRAVTGCETAWAAQHEFRDRVAGARGGLRKYARGLHTDVCPYIEDTLSEPNAKHFAIYNLWWNIDRKQPVSSWPLILCVAPTVDENDIVYSEALRRTDPRTRLIDTRLVHNCGQLFYYYPQLTADEAIIFRQYDTREENANERAIFHCAIKDPTSPENAPLRQSIEVRVVATFAEHDSDRARRKKRFEANIPQQRPDGSISDWRHEKMVDWDYRDW